MNAITLHRMKFFAHHGVCPQEQVVGNRFEVTLQVFCDMEKAMATELTFRGILFLIRLYRGSWMNSFLKAKG